jgi:hypothetical protein
MTRLPFLCSPFCVAAGNQKRRGYNTAFNLPLHGRQLQEDYAAKLHN